jgi:hypothetical protein
MPTRGGRGPWKNRGVRFVGPQGLGICLVRAVDGQGRAPIG